MPLINYVCAGCDVVLKKYFKTAKETPSAVKCECGADAKKAFGAVSCSHKVTIDNGLVARRVEIDPNIMQINDERSQADYSEE
jgi:hypothetical protein